MNTLETFATRIQPSVESVEQFLGTLPESNIALRRHFANPSLPNPVTKVAQRFADLTQVHETITSTLAPHTTEINRAGEDFLAGIHRELEQTPIHLVLSEVNNDNAMAHAHLGIINRVEQEEAETRESEKKEMARSLNPSKPRRGRKPKTVTV